MTIRFSNARSAATSTVADPTAVERLRQRISNERANIDFLLQELKRRGWPDAIRFAELGHVAGGRPPSNPVRLAAQLDRLQNHAAWLHATLIEMRSDSLFADGVRADGSVISAPQEPAVESKRRRGRPHGRHADQRLVYFVELVRVLAETAGRKISLQQILDGLSNGPGFPEVVESADYRRARRRLRAVETTSGSSK